MKKLTKEQRETVERCAGLGLPRDMIATILGYKGRRKLDFAANEDPAVRDALDRGKASMNLTVRKRLYEKVQEGDMRAIEFWCKTQMGFRTTDRVELTGPGGRPIATETTLSDPTREEIVRELSAIRSRLEEDYSE